MNLKKYKKHVLSHWERYVLCLFIILALILRFYNFPFRYGLGDETVRDATVAIVGVREIQAPLTGPFSSSGPFTFGPWYYYQLILAEALLPAPYASWIFLSIASVVTIFILYKIGEILYGKKFGLLLAFLGVISPSLVLTGTHLTNPNLANVFAFLAVYLTLKILKKKVSYWWGFALGIVLGIAINLHYQMLGLLILPLLILIFNPKRFVHLLIAGLGFFITFIPLIFFDLNNHGYNFRNIYYYYTEGRKAIYVPNRWLFYIRDFWPSYISEVIGVPQRVALVGMILFPFLFVYLFYKKKIPSGLFLLAVAFAVNFIMLRYYWGEVFFGYLNFIRPYVLIFTGLMLYSVFLIFGARKFVKPVFFVLIVLMVYFNFSAMKAMLEKDKFTMHVHNVKNTLNARYPDEKFVLYTCPGEGNSYYSSETNSLLFLLDHEKELNSEGRKVAFNNSDCYPPGTVIDEEEKIYNFKATRFIKVPGTDLIELSNHNEASLSAMGWHRYSLNHIYDNTARWWFREQP